MSKHIIKGTDTIITLFDGDVERIAVGKNPGYPYTVKLSLCDLSNAVWLTKDDLTQLLTLMESPND